MLKTRLLLAIAGLLLIAIACGSETDVAVTPSGESIEESTDAAEVIEETVDDVAKEAYIADCEESLGDSWVVGPDSKGCLCMYDAGVTDFGSAQALYEITDEKPDPNTVLPSRITDRVIVIGPTGARTYYNVSDCMTEKSSP